nr:hypothetical protein JVH1_0612 [Rhodococcus sp. JVH1]
MPIYGTVFLLIAWFVRAISVKGRVSSHQRRNTRPGSKIGGTNSSIRGPRSRPADPIRLR